MAPVSLPPGFRFHPSDEELLSYYLKRKVHGRKIELDIIPEVDLYKCEPWDLPNKSFLPNRDMEWYFFSPRDRKYPNGSRTNRATEAGYWKATGKDRKIISQLVVMGMKKTLVFYTGRAPQGKRTDWVMHEYRLDEMQCVGAAGLQDAFVLCRIFKKNGTEHKNGEQNEAQIDNNILSSSMSNSFSETMSSFGYVQEWSEKKYSQIRQEEGGIQANLALPSETSSENLNDKNDCKAPQSWLLESGFSDTNKNGKDSSVFEGPRIQEEFPHPMIKVENNPGYLGDVKLNVPRTLSGSPLTKKLNDHFEEEDILQKILEVAQASQNCNTHLGHSFSVDGFADNLIRESVLENHLPCMGNNYEIFKVEEMNGSPCEDNYLQEGFLSSTWNTYPEMLSGQVQAEFQDNGSVALQREKINLCRWQYSLALSNSLDFSEMDDCLNIPELYS
ncbi:hypothetical protein SUGI_0424440 [Cryptomeria japonica]|uniref:NAC domain-containing protein 71 n=1 Tax=Cryptomeria japonica TaxID=3369 RepID=UPI002408A19D|nr:NAC domain-containing protein 71 [Cryptomeria japonica]GLJ22552.1 hypothetical protein SUGI_0424440 [Cryptomeria japonica]